VHEGKQGKTSAGKGDAGEKNRGEKGAVPTPVTAQKKNEYVPSRSTQSRRNTRGGGASESEEAEKVKRILGRRSLDNKAGNWRRGGEGEYWQEESGRLSWTRPTARGQTAMKTREKGKQRTKSHLREKRGAKQNGEEES